MVSWMVSLVWKAWKGFSLAIAMIACRLIVLITYSSSMLACFALQKKFTAFFVNYVFTVVTTIAYSPRKSGQVET